MPNARRKKPGKPKQQTPVPGESAQSNDVVLQLAGQETFGADYLRLFVALQNAAAGELLFLQVNSPVRRRQLPEQLKADGLQRSFAVADFSTFQPGPPPYGMLREFLESLQPASPEILFVDGLEYWIDANPKPGGVLEELNLGRERLANLGVVVVFLLPFYLINLIRSHALNLWSWRAHHYVLTSSEDEERHYGVPFFSITGHIIAPGDTPEARERRIRILKRLLEEGLAEHRSPEALFHSILLPLTNELHDAGRFAEALDTLELLGNTLEGIKDTQQKADILTFRGVLLIALGELDSAEPLLRQALLIQEEALPPDHLELAHSLHNLARLYHSQGKYTEAESLCRSTLNIYEKRLGADHPNVAMCLNNLALLSYAQGRYTEVVSFCQRALNIYEKALGLEHPQVAHTLNNLALLYQLQGRYAEAEPLYQRALAIYEKALGAEHPDVAGTLENFAHLLRVTKRGTEAEEVEKRAREIRLKHEQQNRSGKYHG